AIELVLLVLARDLFAIDVEELGAIEADALGAVLDGEQRLGRELDVREERHRRAAREARRLARSLSQHLRARQVAIAARTRLFGRLLARADEDLAAKTVDDDRVAGAHVLEHARDADDGGDLERARHDGGVAGARADL